VQILCVNPQCTPISLVDTVIYPFDPPVCPPFTLDFDFTRVWPVLLLSGTPPHPQFSQLFFFLVNCIPIFSVSGLSFLQISLFSHSTLASSTPLPSKWVISQNFSGAFLVFFGFLIGKFSNVIHIFKFEEKNQNDNDYFNLAAKYIFFYTMGKTPYRLISREKFVEDFFSWKTHKRFKAVHVVKKNHKNRKKKKPLFGVKRKNEKKLLTEMSEKCTRIEPEKNTLDDFKGKTICFVTSMDITKAREHEKFWRKIAKIKRGSD
jgi:hypothetical protein